MILSWKWAYFAMGLLPDTLNDGLRMHRECRERFPRHRLQWKPLISDPGMHPGTCVTHVPWCMTGSQIRGGRESVSGIPGACALHNPQFCVCGKRPLVWCIRLGASTNTKKMILLNKELFCSSRCSCIWHSTQCTSQQKSRQNSRRCTGTLRMKNDKPV